MQGRLILLAETTLILASVAVSACGGAAPAPTAAPAAPTTAATVAPTAAPTAAPAAPTTVVAPTAAATSAAPAATTAPPAAASAAPGAVADLTAGKAVFDQNCNACHPGGDKGVGPALKGKNLSADRITRQVRSGGGSMPAFSTSQISDQQLNILVAYIQSLK